MTGWPCFLYDLSLWINVSYKLYLILTFRKTKCYLINKFVAILHNQWGKGNVSECWTEHLSSFTLRVIVFFAFVLIFWCAQKRLFQKNKYLVKMNRSVACVISQVVFAVGCSDGAFFKIILLFEKNQTLRWTTNSNAGFFACNGFLWFLFQRLKGGVIYLLYVWCTENITEDQKDGPNVASYSGQYVKPSDYIL